MDHEERNVILTQPKQVVKIIETLQVMKGASSPASVKLMGDDEELPLLPDQTDYTSKVAMLMFLSQRTYPEIHPAVIKLSTKYNKATAADMEKAMRVAEYIYGYKDTHKMVLSPKNLTLVSAADVSYATPMEKVIVEDWLALTQILAVILALYPPSIQLWQNRWEKRN
jgi:hypothetical protein